MNERGELIKDASDAKFTTSLILHDRML